MAIRKTARLCLLTAISLAFLATLRHVNDDINRLNHLRNHQSRRLSTQTRTYQPQPQQLSVPSSSATTIDQQDASSPSSSSEGYTYLIIHYHKSGHILTQNLRDILLQADPSLTRNYIDRFPKRQHDDTTKCPHLTLHPNAVYVQSSPDFFCNIHTLAEELLTRPTKQRGIKLIHLIRNPFTMAISNYKYHSQDPLPENENWVKRTNPCLVEEKSSVVYAQLFMKTLVASPGAYRLMEYDDFQMIHAMCHRFYDDESLTNHTNSPGFYTNLLNLPPTEGLLLATTYLMLGRGGDILRMANNIIKLRQLQLLERTIHLQQHTLPEFNDESKRKVQVLTMSMDDFIARPKGFLIQFLDFVSLGNEGVVVGSENGSNKDTNGYGGGELLSPNEKEEIATRYEQMYYEKVSAGDEHITSLLSKTTKEVVTDNGGGGDKSSSKETKTVVMSHAELEQSLRKNVLWGRVLGNIENLVDESLRGVHNWYR
eukprot:scaffold4396_cov141-Skeletonema_menzelii.AAC.5